MGLGASSEKEVDILDEYLEKLKNSPETGDIYRVRKEELKSLIKEAVREVLEEKR